MLAEAVTIAEVVTGIESHVLVRASRLELLDSALHAPQAGFGDDDFYPDFVDKAAVLVVRITRNHPPRKRSSPWALVCGSDQPRERHVHAWISEDPE